MSNPRLSPVFNNCPLHALTPSLKQVIEQLGNGQDNAFKEHYELLKDCFVTYYGLDRDSFEWKNFSELLKRYNAFDVQILMGPVLRMVLARHLSSEEMQENVTMMLLGDEDVAELTNEEFIKYKTELHEPGRYESLSPDELFISLAKPFGFNLTYHQGDRSHESKLDDPTAALSTITMYHSGSIQGGREGGHWELERDPSELVYFELEDTTQLRAQIELFGNDFSITQYGMNFLKKNIQLMHRSLQSGDKLEGEFARLSLTLAQIDKFLYNVNHVNKSLAEKLLGDQVTEETKEFIRQLLESEIDYDPNFIKFVEAHIAENFRYHPEKPTGVTYTPDQYNIALVLLTPVVPPIHPLPIETTPPASVVRSPRRTLRAEEVSALQDVEFLLLNEGLSNALYEVCNKPDIIALLTAPFIEQLLKDDLFLDRASAALQQKAKELLPEMVTTRSALPLVGEGPGEREEDVTRPPSSPTLLPHAGEGSHGIQRSAKSPPPHNDSASSVSSSHSDALEEQTSEETPPPKPPNYHAHLAGIMSALKDELSAHVWMGVSREEKVAAIDRLIGKNNQPEAKLEDIFRELVKIVTTHRTRFGIFFHVSRNNSSTTDTAFALSELLTLDCYKPLLKKLGYENITSAKQIRDEFDKMVSGLDYYPVLKNNPPM